MLSVQDLHDRAGNLDLSHWNAAETFSLMEATLLSVGFDPLEYTGLDCLRKNNHPNWKNGMLLLRSLREGVCTGEIVCIDIFIKSYHNGLWNNYGEKVDALDLSVGQADHILEGLTKISRKALFDWYKRKGLLRTQKVINRNALNQRAETNISAMITIEEQLPALAAPSYLDPTNPLSPRELRASIDAWAAVTSNGDPRESGAAVRAALRKYLDAHEEHGALSNEAKNRICTVANWNKKGGATSTPY